VNTGSKGSYSNDEELMTLNKVHSSEKWIRRCKILLLIAAIIMLNLSGGWIAQYIDFQIYPRHEPYLNAALLGFVLIYIALMALPFMPGIEVGLALMLILGSKGAILVYFCTLVALIISFLIGRITSPLFICNLLNWLHLSKASALVTQLTPLDGFARLELLQAKAPKRIAPFVLRHRYLSIMILINLPGNALIGGGGGIALISGMSRLIPLHVFVFIIALAIAPVPLTFYIQGF
jgi:hypothetical protein